MEPSNLDCEEKEKEKSIVLQGKEKLKTILETEKRS